MAFHVKDVGVGTDNTKFKTTADGSNGERAHHVEDESVPLGSQSDAEATGDGSAIAILKRHRTLLGTIAGAVKAEDAVHASGDPGVMTLAVRADSAAALAGTTGDYAPFQVDANGALRVSGSGSTSVTEYVEDAASAANPSGPVFMAVRRDTLTASEVSADGDNVALKATNKGELHTRDAAVLEALTNATANATGLATGQNALSTSAEEVLAAATRIFAEVKNTSTTITVFLGDDNTVSPTTGHALAPGEAFTFEGYTGAIWAIAASGTPTVTYISW